MLGGGVEVQPIMGAPTPMPICSGAVAKLTKRSSLRQPGVGWLRLECRQSLLLRISALAMLSRSLLAVLAVAALLSACAAGPDYVRPTLAVPAAYKESGDWKPADPRPVASGLAW